MLYQRAIDADKALDAFSKNGQGKFESVFKASAHFKISANRFQPYVLEVAEKLSRLEASFDTAEVAPILHQMQLLTETLEAFKASTQSIPNVSFCLSLLRYFL